MAVSIDDVKHIAELARLRFTEGELGSFTHDLNQILEYVEQLNRLNTDNVEPLSHPIPDENVFREDHSVPSVSTEEALKNAPDRTELYFRVPKVIKAESPA